MKRVVLAITLALVIRLPIPVSAATPPPLSNTPRADLWIAGAPVADAEVVGDLAYISGMAYVGPFTGLAARLDPVTGATLPPFPRLDGDVDAGVLASAPDGSGGWFLGGSFTQADGVTRRGLAHVLPDGTLDAEWAPQADGAVNTLVLSGTTVYIGGAFAAVDGVARSHLAALDTTTGELTPWNPGADGPVHCLAALGETLYVGGAFQQVGGQYRPYAAQLDLATGQATWWNPMADGPVHALALGGSALYVGGHFSAIGWSAHANIAALDLTTGGAKAWSPSISGSNAAVTALALGADTVYAGGYFATVNGAACSNLVFLNATTGATRLCRATDSGGPDALVLSGDTLYVGGQFHTIAGQAREHLAALDTTTGIPNGWNPAPNAPVRSLALGGSVLYAGGYFRSIAMLPRTIAALDLSTGQPTAWAPQIVGSGGVGPFVISGTVAYVSGTFSHIGGEDRYRLAALDLTTGLATSWNPWASGWTSAEVRAMIRVGNTIYVGGSIWKLGDLTPHHLVAIDAVTGAILPWSPLVNDHSVYALAASGNTLFAGGDFYDINGTRAQGLVALDGTTGAIIPWDPPDLGCYLVDSLVVSANTLYVGGQFTRIGGLERGHLAAIDLTTRRVTAWNPRASSWVTALGLSGDTLYAGGHFSSIGGQPRNRLAALSITTGLPNAWNPSLQYYPPYVLVPMGDSLLVGGNFAFVGTQGRSNLAAFDPQVGAYEAGVALAKTDGLDTVMPGASTTYTLTVTNAGPDPAGVSVTDVFPASFLIASWYCRAGAFSRCGSDGGSGDISVALTIGPGDRVLLIAQGQVSKSARGVLVNTATVSPPPGVTDPDLTDNSATDTTTIGGAYGVYVPLILRNL